MRKLRAELRLRVIAAGPYNKNVIKSASANTHTTTILKGQLRHLWEAVKFFYYFLSPLALLARVPSAAYAEIFAACSPLPDRRPKKFWIKSKIGRQTSSACVRASSKEPARVCPDETHLGLVMVMMKFIISSVETTPSRLESARRRILPGTPRLDTMRWNVSGRTGSSYISSRVY